MATAARTVDEMLDQLTAEQITVNEAAEWVRKHNWPPARSAPPPRSGAGMWADQETDAEPFPDGGVQRIAVAYHSGRIDNGTYGRLTSAYVDAQRANRPGR